MIPKRITPGSDELVELAGLVDELTKEYLDDSGGVTVVGTLKDDQDADVDGQAWPSPFTHANGPVTLPSGEVIAEGNWWLILEDGLELTVDKVYTLEVIATDVVGGGRRIWNLKYLAQEPIDQ